MLPVKAKLTPTSYAGLPEHFKNQCEFLKGTKDFTDPRVYLKRADVEPLVKAGAFYMARLGVLGHEATGEGGEGLLRLVRCCSRARTGALPRASPLPGPFLTSPLSPLPENSLSSRSLPPSRSSCRTSTMSCPRRACRIPRHAPQSVTASRGCSRSFGGRIRQARS